MPAIIDNMTFGGRKLKGFATNTEKFAGQTYNQTVALWPNKRGDAGGSGESAWTAAIGGMNQAETAAATHGATEGLDLGPVHGNYKDWYHLRLLCTDQFSATAVNSGAGTITFKLYTSASETETLTEILAVTMSVATFNKHRNTPVEISLPSDIKRFVVLGVTVSTCADSEAGSIMATIEPKAW